MTLPLLSLSFVTDHQILDVDTSLQFDLDWVVAFLYRVEQHPFVMFLLFQVYDLMMIQL